MGDGKREKKGVASSHLQVITGSKNSRKAKKKGDARGGSVYGRGSTVHTVLPEKGKETRENAARHNCLSKHFRTNKERG